MMSRAREVYPVVVTIGFAAVAGGMGVAYAGWISAGDAAESLVRVGFRCRPLAALHGRDVAYAALDAVACELRRRNLDRVELRIENSELGLDLAEHRTVPQALIVPYVKLRCTLNRFAEASVVVSREAAVRDRTARAQAEVSLHVAA